MDQPFQALALDLWNGSQALCEAFAANAEISYPVLMNAGAAGVGTDYATTWHRVFIVDSNGIIVFRGNGEVDVEAIRAVIDQALEDITETAVGDELPSRGVISLSNYPNPFNPSTTISYELAGGGNEVEVRLDVIDLQGRLLRTLFSGRQTTGRRYEMTWNGRDASGRSLASGSYISQLTVGNEHQARILTLVK